MTLKLLIVDDDADDAWLVARAVKRAGYAVVWTRVDDEPGFARELPASELVICDFSMPRFSPVRALELIRATGRTTPFVLVSGSVTADWARRLMLLGAAGYVSKDGLDRLGPAVRDALAGGKPAALP